MSSEAPGCEELADRVRLLTMDERSWVLYWLAYEADPAGRALFAAALDHQVARKQRSG